MFLDGCELRIWEDELDQVTHPAVKAVLDMFNQGYYSGLNWLDRWEHHRPSGPWTYGNIYHERNPIFIEMAKQSRREFEAWHAGWEFGHAEKIRTGRKNEHPIDDTPFYQKKLGLKELVESYLIKR